MNIKLSLLLIVLLCAFSCDDGDIITVDLDFDDIDVEQCGEIVFYKSKSSPAETLSIQLDGIELDNLIELDGQSQVQEQFSFNGNTNRLNYRTYSELPDMPFCNAIPPSELNITSDDESDSGSVVLLITLTEDDQDGIPAELEDLNGNGDLTDDDTDGDGLPNYIDADDDGDNVPTTAENPNYNEDDGLSLAQDTDGDGIPDYLDDDDDGDGTKTRYEGNDRTQPDNGPDYLNPFVSDALPATELIEHTIFQTYTIDITLFDIELANLVQDESFFGTIEEERSRTFTPELEEDDD